jgi:hypothetical protein
VLSFHRRGTKEGEGCAEAASLQVAEGTKTAWLDRDRRGKDGMLTLRQQRRQQRRSEKQSEDNKSAFVLDERVSRKQEE